MMLVADSYEIWMLGLASRIPAPVEWLVPNIKFDAFNVAAVDSLTPAHCGELLVKLDRAGAIKVSEDGTILTSSDSDAAVRDLLNGAKRRLDFELTESGGRVWENTARPDWSRFVQVYSDSRPEGQLVGPGVVAGVNWDVVVAYLGHYEFLRDERIVPESLRHTLHDRYNITYWKTLPAVHVFSFQCFPSQDSNYDRPGWLRDWWSTISEC